MHQIMEKRSSELKDTSKDLDRLKAQVESLNREMEKLGKESSKSQASGNSGSSEKHEHLMAMLKEVQEAKRLQAQQKNQGERQSRDRKNSSEQENKPDRNGRGKSMTRDVLPWCDEPKGNYPKQQFQHNQPGARGPRNQQQDEAFQFVNFSDCNASGQRGRGGHVGAPRGKQNFQPRGSAPFKGRGGQQYQQHQQQQRGQWNGPPPLFNSVPQPQQAQWNGPPPLFNSVPQPQQAQWQERESTHWQGTQYRGKRGQNQPRGRGTFVPRGQLQNSYRGGSLQNVSAQQEGVVADVMVRLSTQQQTVKTSTENVAQHFTPEDIRLLKNALKKERPGNKTPKKKTKKKSKVQENKPAKDETDSAESSDESDESDEVEETVKQPPPKVEIKPPVTKTKKKKKKAAVVTSSAVATADASEGAVGGASGSEEGNTNLKLFLGAGYDSSIFEVLDKNLPVKDVMMVAKEGGLITTCQPRTIGELKEFKKKYPNAETVIVK